MSIASLKSVPLDERSKTLHITRMFFPTVYPIKALLFKSPR